MKIIQTENHIFVRHWFKWYVGNQKDHSFIFIETMMPIFGLAKNDHIPHFKYPLGIQKLYKKNESKR